jgi:hypothetical protein
MNDRNHERRHWERVFAALIIAGLIGIIIVLFLRSPPAETPDGPPPLPIETTAKVVPPKLPVPLPLLDRAQLLTAAAAAADAVASGRQLPRQNAALVGRSFAVRLPFGCDGPLTDPASDWAGWTYNSRTKALKLRASPETWDEAPWVKALTGDMPFEAAEGFWIRRPWSSVDNCLAGAAGDPERQDHGSAGRQTVGLVQFFAPDTPRSLRRGPRPYSATIRTDDAIMDGPREYRLVIEGRIGSFPDGQPIHCWNEARDLRPICLISIQFNSVAFEDPRDGKVLSEWRR